MKPRVIGSIAGATCVCACSLLAFVTNIGPPWPNGNVVMHLQLGNSPTYSDGTNPNSTGTAALQHWNGYMGRLQLVANAGSNANKAEGNGINNVFFSSTIYGQTFPPGVLAVALSSSDNNNRVEGDVIVNSARTWDSYRGPLATSGAIDLRRVLIHEFGHVLGLGHPDEAGQYVEAIMNSTISHLDGTTQDDQNGVASFYGRGIANPAVAPSIPAAEPFDQTAESGWHVNFYVNAQGTSPLTFQWFKDGVAIPDATTENYTILFARTTNAGGYSVRVSNEAGYATSRTATLTVNPPMPPSIPAFQPQDFTVTESASFLWSVDVGGTQPTTFQWRKDGIDIPGTDSPFFYLDSVQLSDSGLYSLRATNEAGTTLSREARLQVVPGMPPTIMAWPEPISSMVGLRTTFNVQAMSPLPISYQWLKDGEPIPFANDSSFTISPVAEENDGEYSVVVSTEFGSVPSPAVPLTVYPAPQPPITIARAVQQTVQVGERLALGTITVGLVGRPTYQWHRNGNPIPGAHSSSYLVFSASEADAGEYHVVVSNETGSTASTKVSVTVQPAPVPDRDWLSCQRHGDIVYFLFQGPATIERFSVAADAFLPSIPLSRTPTAMTVHEGMIVVAFEDQISHFPLAGGEETALGAGPDSILSITGHGNFLYGLADTHQDHDTLFSFGIQNGTVSSTVALSYNQAPGLLVDPLTQRLIARTTSGIPFVVGFDTHGGFTFGGPQGEAYRGGFPDDRYFLSPDNSLLLAQSGTVYRTSDLTFVETVSEHFDDAAFLPHGRLLLLRHDKLVLHSISWEETGSVQVAGKGDAIAIDESEAIVFTQPATAGSAIRWQRVSLDQLVPKEPPINVNSDHLLIEPDGVWLAADGTVLVYSREHNHVLRWSVDEQKYLNPIPISGDADRVWYSRDYDRLYISFSDREIRTILLDETPTDEHFASLAGDLFDLAEMGDHLLAVDQVSSGTAFRIYARNGHEVALETWRANLSESYAWNANKRRLYYFDAGSSARPVHSLELLADGTIGERDSMFPYTIKEESLLPPIFISPAGDMLLLGSGLFLDADTFQGRSFSLTNRIDDAVWQGTTLFTATSRLPGVEVQRWDGTGFGLERTRALPGRLLKLFPIRSTQLLAVTLYAGEVHFTILDQELTVQNRFPGARTPKNRLISISTRGEVGTGDAVIIAGFVVNGNTSKRVLVRAVGPTLASFDVTGVLADPMLTIYDHLSSPIADNDDWEDSDPAGVATAFETAGAFPLPSGSADASMILTLAPGLYSAVVSGKNDQTGVALVEVYDLEPGASEQRLISISTRAHVGTGSSILIPGLAVSGSEPKRLLVRAIGPGLIRFGVPREQVLFDPLLEVIDRHGKVVANNDNWGTGNPGAVRTAGEATGAFPLNIRDSDAALVVMLEPGLYTVVVRGFFDSTGIALVEAYEIP